MRKLVRRPTRKFQDAGKIEMSDFLKAFDENNEKYVKGIRDLLNRNMETILNAKEDNEKTQAQSYNRAIKKTIKNLWDFENPKKKGFRNGKYYVYDGTNGHKEIGPGLDLDENPSMLERAKRGMSEGELNEFMTDFLKDEFPHIYRNILKHGTPRLTENQYSALMDIYWQIKNGLYGYANLFKALVDKDEERIKEESKVYWKDNGTRRLDERRWKLRLPYLLSF